MVGLLLLLLPEKFPAIELWMAVTLEFSFSLILYSISRPRLMENNLVLYIVAIFPCSLTARDILRSAKSVVRCQESEGMIQYSKKRGWQLYANINTQSAQREY